MQEEIKTFSVPIDEWLKLINSGVYSVARVTPTGNSMWPLIRSCRDQIEVKPVDREIKLGDVVVFKRIDGKSVVHRVWKISDDGKRVQTFGDNCVRPDAPVNISDVCGIATKVFRDGKEIDIDSDEARNAINFFPKYAPVRRIIYGAKGKARAVAYKLGYGKLKNKKVKK